VADNDSRDGKRDEGEKIGLQNAARHSETVYSRHEVMHIGMSN